MEENESSSPPESSSTMANRLTSGDDWPSSGLSLSARSDELPTPFSDKDRIRSYSAALSRSSAASAAERAASSTTPSMAASVSSKLASSSSPSLRWMDVRPRTRRSIRVLVSATTRSSVFIPCSTSESVAVLQSAATDAWLAFRLLLDRVLELARPRRPKARLRAPMDVVPDDLGSDGAMDEAEMTGIDAVCGVPDATRWCAPPVGTSLDESDVTDPRRGVFGLTTGFPDDGADCVDNDDVFNPGAASAAVGPCSCGIGLSAPARGVVPPDR